MTLKCPKNWMFHKPRSPFISFDNSFASVSYLDMSSLSQYLTPNDAILSNQCQSGMHSHGKFLGLRRCISFTYCMPNNQISLMPYVQLKH